MGHSASWFPTTVAGLFREGKYSVLLSPSQLQYAWFGNFWGWAGPGIREGGGERVIPLLEGRTSGGRIVEEPTGPGIEGTVIEIGAGSGFWVDVFSDKYLAVDEGGSKASGIDTDGIGAGEVTSRSKSARKRVTRVYGVEPNRDQHPSLRRKIAEAGLQDVYEIVPVGIEDLDNPAKWDGKVEKGSVDCIVSILCLCSIPEPQKNFKELHAYLKKGGRWYIYEHVRVDVNWGMRVYQGELLPRVPIHVRQ
jgi:SAM-dependent methyltransferase